MKQNSALVFASVLAIGFGTAAAHAGIVVIESINAITTKNDPWEAFFPNEFDLLHPKELRFEGIATVGGDPSISLPATLYVQFDWVDPVLGVIYSPPWAFPVSYTPMMTPIDVSWTIPFCPEQVSLHFATDTPDGGVVNFAGSFTHWCVPEPGSYALVAALGLAGFAGWRHRTVSRA